LDIIWAIPKKQKTETVDFQTISVYGGGERGIIFMIPLLPRMEPKQ